MCVLALDIGASFIKGARVHPHDGVIEHVVRKPFPPFCEGLPAGRREVRLGEILAATREVLDEVLLEGPVPAQSGSQRDSPSLVAAPGVAAV
jgi:hypothetical protein